MTIEVLDKYYNVLTILNDIIDWHGISNKETNVDKIVLDMDLIAKNTIYQKTRGYYK